MKKPSPQSQKKRPESVELNRSNNEPIPSTVEDQIEARIREDLNLIKTFDENKDGVLDDNEIGKAVAKAKNWATEVSNPDKNWFYYGQNKPVGPVEWDEILTMFKTYPQVFISKKSNPAEKSASLNWLPASIVLLAKELLEK